MEQITVDSSKWLKYFEFIKKSWFFSKIVFVMIKKNFIFDGFLNICGDGYDSKKYYIKFCLMMNNDMDEWGYGWYFS